MSKPGTVAARPASQRAPANLKRRSMNSSFTAWRGRLPGFAPPATRGAQRLRPGHAPGSRAARPLS
eukprot:19176-Alexandrium_andersonii.AAC.1